MTTLLFFGILLSRGPAGLRGRDDLVFIIFLFRRCLALELLVLALRLFGLILLALQLSLHLRPLLIRHPLRVMVPLLVLGHDDLQVRGPELLSLEFGYEPLALRSPTTTLSSHILLKLRFRIRRLQPPSYYFLRISEKNT